jgi:hypothetical protein
MALDQSRVSDYYDDDAFESFEHSLPSSPQRPQGQAGQGHQGVGLEQWEQLSPIRASRSYAEDFEDEGSNSPVQVVRSEDDTVPMGIAAINQSFDANKSVHADHAREEGQSYLAEYSVDFEEPSQANIPSPTEDPVPSDPVEQTNFPQLEAISDNGKVSSSSQHPLSLQLPEQINIVINPDSNPLPPLLIPTKEENETDEYDEYSPFEQPETITTHTKDHEEQKALGTNSTTELHKDHVPSVISTVQLAPAILTSNHTHSSNNNNLNNEIKIKKVAKRLPPRNHGLKSLPPVNQDPPPRKPPLPAEARIGVVRPRSASVLPPTGPGRTPYPNYLTRQHSNEQAGTSSSTETSPMRYAHPLRFDFDQNLPSLSSLCPHRLKYEHCKQQYCVEAREAVTWLKTLVAKAKETAELVETAREMWIEKLYNSLEQAIQEMQDHHEQEVSSLFLSIYF